MKMPAFMISKLSQANAGSAEDVLVRLVLAAREDAAFRNRVLLVLKMSAQHRESLIKTAVAQMERRGESAEMRAAFLTLANPDGADAAVRAIEGG